MDKTIPAAAQDILKFIYQGEANGDYNKLSANAETRGAAKPTTLTINQVLSTYGSGDYRRKYKMISSAAGAPQIITATLKTLKAKLGLTGKEKYDANMQDRLAYQLLRDRGYDAWVSGRIDTVEFARRLAMEWASLPVLAGTKNARKQNIKRGQGYYDGDGLNSAKHVSADRWEGVLNRAKNQTAFVNVKPADSAPAAATKVAVAVSTGAAVVGGASEASRAITDWQPVLELATAVGKYGPAVAGGIVVGVVLFVIGRKLFKKD